MQESTAETHELTTLCYTNKPMVVCRLCTLSLRDGSMEPNIFLSSEGGSLADKIASVTRLTLYEGDGLPTTVCQQCLFQLDMADRFIQKCLDSNKSLLSKLIPQDQAIGTGSNIKTLCKQAMQTAPSEDFLMALEYVEATQDAELQEDSSLQSTEFQVPLNVSISEEDLEDCAFFDLENFAELCVDLDEVDNISLSMEEYGEFSLPLSKEDSRVCHEEIAIGAEDPQHANFDESLQSVEKQLEPIAKEIPVQISGFPEHPSSSLVNNTNNEAKRNQMKSATSTNVVQMVGPKSLASCSNGLAFDQPTSPQDRKQLPIAIQDPNCSDRKLRKRFSDGLPVLNGNNQPRLAIAKSRKLAGTLNVKNSKFTCDKCFLAFASNILLKMHIESRVCKPMCLRLRKISTDCRNKLQLFDKAKVAAGTLVIQSTLDSNLEGKSLQSRQDVDSLNSTKPNPNCVDLRPFKCTSCSRSYKTGKGLKKHIEEKHLVPESSENKFD